MAAGADPDLALRLAQAVADLYGDATRRLLELVARRLASGIDAPGWPERKLAELLAVQRQARAVLTQVEARVPEEAAKAVTAAWGAPSTGYDRAVQALARDLTGQLTATHPRIVRSTVDAYRETVAQASAETLTGAGTRRQAAQQVLDRFADRGIGGMVDRSGRQWAADTYAEMATRTTVGRAQVAGALDRMTDDGRDLVIVSNAPQECKTCRRWEGRVLSISGATPGYPTVADATADGLLHANCFPGEVLAGGPLPVAGDRRWYEGDLVVIHTASGVELPVTPNHPVLTAEGWVAAGALREGDHVLRHLPEVEVGGRADPDDVKVPSPIGQVVGALREAVEMVTVSVPASAEQFHGDGSRHGQVDVVAPLGLLRDDGVSCTCDHGRQLPLLVGGVGLGALVPERSAGQVLVGADHASDGLVGGGHLERPLRGVHGRPLPGLGLAASDLRPSDLDPAPDRGLSDAEGGRQLVLALAGSVALDEVVHLGRREFAGHVYNLQTGAGWYTAGSIVVHNCRHRLGGYIEGVTKPLTDTADPEGDAARQEQRRLERGVRRWKQRAAAAMDDTERKRCEAKAREWQGRVRAHVKSTGLIRRPERERLGAR